MADKADPPRTADGRVPHAGMPPLEPRRKPLSLFEFWPTKLFYAPMALYWVWLAIRYRGTTLPTNANPGFPGSGLIGESKFEVLSRVTDNARNLLAHYTRLKCVGADTHVEKVDRALAVMRHAGLDFPVVLKPDIGCRGIGVQVARSREDLAGYLSEFPEHADLLIQELIDLEGEAGIFYVRYPGAENGEIFSVTLKYFPYVIGNGRATLRELIERDSRAGRIADIYLPRHRDRLDEVIPENEAFRLAFAGSHSRGTIFRDGQRFVTPAMTRAFDAIARDIPEFYFGRFDIRFADFAEVRAGRGFRIVEVNGAGGEATHVWDSGIRLIDAYRALMRQYDHLHAIGAINRNRGYKPMSLFGMARLYATEKRLNPHYPLTH